MWTRPRRSHGATEWIGPLVGIGNPFSHLALFARHPDLWDVLWVNLPPAAVAAGRGRR